MPIVTVQQFAGRTEDQKRELARLITEAVNKVNGSKPIDIHVIFQEVPGDCWLQGAEFLRPRHQMPEQK